MHNFKIRDHPGGGTLVPYYPALSNFKDSSLLISLSSPTDETCSEWIFDGTEIRALIARISPFPVLQNPIQASLS